MITATNAQRTEALKDGQAVRFRFKVNTTSARANLMVERGTDGNSNYRRWSLELTGGNLMRVYNQGTSSASTSLMALKADTWYEVVLGIDGSDPSTASSSHAPRMRLVVWEADNPDNWAQSLEPFAANWSYSDWVYLVQVKNGIVDIEYEQEYDDGAIGQRTEMTDGSGNTAWEYTPRGEVEKESKVVTGSGTFVTKWGYHPDGSMRWMQYPDNEKLTYAYLPQKTLKDRADQPGKRIVLRVQH